MYVKYSILQFYNFIFLYKFIGRITIGPGSFTNVVVTVKRVA